ncbi:MAG TPA: hypothetical protein VF485_00845 [Sphingomonas sp.]
MPILFLLAAAALVPQQADDDAAVDITPGHCVAAADRLDDAARLARTMLDSKSAAGGPDRTPTEARVARAQAVAAAIRTRYPKVTATDDDRDDLSGGDVMPFAEQCLTAKPAKEK